MQRPAGDRSETPRKKRALSHQGGAIETEGDSADAAVLAHALDVSPATDEENDPARQHIHGFHTYPARMHPVTAARLVTGFSLPEGRILDPFCGSGTVLVEALIAGRQAFGVDLNPFAVLLSKCKTKIRGSKDLQLLLDAAGAIAGLADDRRLAKAKSTKKYTKADLVLFEPHILMELDSLQMGIQEKKNHPAAADLWMVLSSMLVKFSRQPSDTSTATKSRKLAAGFPARHFLRKTEELTQRAAEFGQLVGSQPQIAKVWQGNAQLLKGLEIEAIDAIVTSPPYAATYDYSQHHALRSRWLGLKVKEFEKGEMGARTAYRNLDPQKAAARWHEELAHFLKAASAHLRPGLPLVLVVADSSVGPVALRADAAITSIARDCGFYPSARASQARPHFHGPGAAAFRELPRREHAIVLRRLPTKNPRASSFTHHQPLT